MYIQNQVRIKNFTITYVHGQFNSISIYVCVCKLLHCGCVYLRHILRKYFFFLFSVGESHSEKPVHGNTYTSSGPAYADVDCPTPLALIQYFNISIVLLFMYCVRHVLYSLDLRRLDSY
jgi:hypothetical protein